MEIDFYEEFPTAENLARLRLLPFPVSLHVAAPNLEQFRRLRDEVRGLGQVRDVGYWPVLEQEEGYWLSPFSKREALERVLGELQGLDEELTVMWDAELPFLKPSLLLWELPGFFGKRKLIRDFVATAPEKGIRLVTSEYAVKRTVVDWLLQILGVRFPLEGGGHKRIVMFYTSMLGGPSARHATLRQIRRARQRFGPGLGVALGTIAEGIFGTEPILPPSHLKRDLAEVAELGVENVTIFRLGGLTPDYVEVLEEYASGSE